MANQDSNQNPFGLSLLREQLKAPTLNPRGTEMQQLTLTEPKLDVRGIQNSRPTLEERGINQNFRSPILESQLRLKKSEFGRVDDAENQKNPFGISLAKNALRVPRVTKIIQFQGSELALDFDGSRHAYHQNNEGLDRNKNAGIGTDTNNVNDAENNTFRTEKKSNGEWKFAYGIATRIIKKENVRKGYPLPDGYFVSETPLHFKNINDEGNPERYVDAEKIPYIALRQDMRAKGIRLGDIALVTNEYNKLHSFAIFADSPPPNSNTIEISFALANELKIPLGISREFSDDNKKIVTKYTSIKPRPLKIYAFKGSGDGYAKTFDEIKTIGNEYIKFMPEFNSNLK